MKIIIFTGMCNFDEINQTVKILKKIIIEILAYHCVSTYPTKSKFKFKKLFF